MHLGRFAALSSLPLLAPAEWIVAQSPPSNPAPAPCWVVDKLKKILVQQLGLKPSQITLQSSLVELGVDSLDQVELVMACEEEFDIEIKESDACKFKTVADLVRGVESHLPPAKLKPPC